MSSEKIGLYIYNKKKVNTKSKMGSRHSRKVTKITINFIGFIEFDCEFGDFLHCLQKN